MMKWQQGIHRGEGNKALHLVVSEAIVHLITQQGEGLATKTDIAALRGDMATKADLAELKAGLAELKSSYSSL